jgi:hypothetical protein
MPDVSTLWLRHPRLCSQTLPSAFQLTHDESHNRRSHPTSLHISFATTLAYDGSSEAYYQGDGTFDERAVSAPTTLLWAGADDGLFAGCRAFLRLPTMTICATLT